MGTMNTGSQFETSLRSSLEIPASCGVAVRNYSWEIVYKEAILETDRQVIYQKIKKAENAMASRKVELSRDRNRNVEELNALEDGLRNLRVLKKSEYSID
jgi:hypothetical protein